MTMTATILHHNETTLSTFVPTFGKEISSEWVYSKTDNNVIIT